MGKIFRKRSLLKNFPDLKELLIHTDPVQLCRQKTEKCYGDDLNFMTERKNRHLNFEERYSILRRNGKALMRDNGRPEIRSMLKNGFPGWIAEILFQDQWQKKQRSSAR